MTTAAGGLKVDHRARGVPARAPAPREAADGRAAQGGRAGRGAALRRGPRRVHRRQVVHALQRLPVADARRRIRTRCATTRSPTWTQSCVGCGVCGEVAHAAVLCPSFYETRVVRNPGAGTRALAALRRARHRLARSRRVMAEAPRPVSILIAALGGQGGGVLTEWIVGAAGHAGYPAQATSIPGVAQRTGATTYYVEVFPERIEAGRRRADLLALSRCRATWT